ncbi:STAS domain-containing protein [Polyangium mundeleinium]|uniref:PAS domain-containing protein n=1 Tax=Polyangium mundeleinium TaxID=2995306 RepID=A0ABT5F535_9BACT|nr:PAS domain-containing protein [Polyangium mundeleinium]MDC0748210.1 PAS domain-containing protein [Polyangium mundeleinium]
MDHAARMRRITDTLARLVDEEVPPLIEVIEDGPLGDIEREVNRAVTSLCARLEERLIFRVGPVVVFRWRAEPGWPVEYVSPNVLDLTGYPAEEFLSFTRTLSDLIVPEDVQRITEELRAFEASRVEWFTQSPYRIRKRDGRTIWVSDTAVIQRDPWTQEVTHYFGYIFDSTDHIEQSIRLQQNESTLRRLASPLLHVWDGVLAMPVIGALDETRAAHMTETLLQSITDGGIKVSVIDLTGLDDVDAATLEHIIRMVRAAELLGSQCLVSGISSRVAAAIVSLGVDVTKLHTFATLSAALGHALRHRNLRRAGP